MNMAANWDFILTKFSLNQFLYKKPLKTRCVNVYHAFTLVLLCIKQCTKFEVLIFTDSKDIIGAKFKKNGSWVT